MRIRSGIFIFSLRIIISGFFITKSRILIFEKLCISTILLSKSYGALKVTSLLIPIIFLHFDMTNLFLNSFCSQGSVLRPGIFTLCTIIGRMPGLESELLRSQPGVLPINYLSPLSQILITLPFFLFIAKCFRGDILGTYHGLTFLPESVFRIRIHLNPDPVF